MRLHSRWRPAPAVAAPAPARKPTRSEGGGAIGDEQSSSRHRSRTVIALVTVIAVAAIATQQHAGASTSVARLPVTPRQWVDQWTAAALDSPERVCGQLFAPALSAAYRSDTGRSCTAYYASVRTTSFRIRHVLQDGGTATVEAQQLGDGRAWGYFTMVLSHVGSGWQAVDVVPGGSIRTR
jgi:hypothetical protein